MDSEETDLVLKSLGSLQRSRSNSPHPGTPRSGSPNCDSPRSDSPRSDSPHSDSPHSDSHHSDSHHPDSPRSDSYLSDSLPIEPLRGLIPLYDLTLIKPPPNDDKCYTPQDDSGSPQNGKQYDVLNRFSPASDRVSRHTTFMFWNCSDCGVRLNRQSEVLDHSCRRMRSSAPPINAHLTTVIPLVSDECNGMEESNSRPSLPPSPIYSPHLPTRLSARIPPLILPRTRKNASTNGVVPPAKKMRVDKKFLSLRNSPHQDFSLQNSHNQFVCSFCGKAFKTPPAFAFHLRQQHLGNASFCSNCRRPFENETQLGFHTNVGKCSTHCEFCDSDFKTLSKLVAHQEIHNLQQDCKMAVVCQHCEKHFVNSTALTYHLLNGKCRSHQCATCCLKFASDVKLREHERHHTEPLKCVYCLRGFTQKKIFDAHSRKHKQCSKPYECLRCGGVRFAHRKAFKDHCKSVHQKARYTFCTYCTKKVTKGHVRDHINRHTAEKKMKCRHCEEEFESYYRRMLHMNKEHSALQNDRKHKLVQAGRDDPIELD